MRAIAVLFIVLLVTLAFAGCTEKAQEKGGEAKSFGGGRAPKVVNRTAIEQRLNRSIATSGEEKLGDWFVLRASAAPQGNLTGFKFNIPDGALIPAQFGRGSSLVFEVVPIVVGPPENILEWLFLPFLAQDGRLRVANVDPFGRTGPAVIVETPAKESDLSLPNPTTKDLPVSFAPRFTVYTDDQLRVPGSIYFVVGARATQAVEFGIALRLVDHRPAPQEKPPADLEMLLDDVGRAVPFGVQIVGQGTGFMVASYSTETGLLETQPVSLHDVRTATVKVEDRVAVRQVPAVDIRDTLISSTFEATEGWTYATGYYQSYCATGKYQVRIEAHGKTYTPRGIIAQHLICGGLYAGIVEAVLFGFEVAYTFSADGPGASKVGFDFQVAHALIEVQRYQHVGLGASLSTLLGRSALHVQHASQGLVGNVPPGMMTGSDLG